MKLPTWSEFLAIFVAAFVTAVSINLLWGSYSQARMAHNEPLFAPIMLDKTTQARPLKAAIECGFRPRSYRGLPSTAAHGRMCGAPSARSIP